MSILTKTLRIASKTCRPSLLSFPPRTRPFTAQLQAGLAFSISYPSASFAFPPSPPDNICPDTTAAHPSFLEDPDELEYGLPKDTPTSGYHADTSSTTSTDETALLISLLSRGETKRALVIKNEYDALDIQLARHRVFAHTAFAALAERFMDSNLRAERFLIWWALVDLKTYPRAFFRAEKLLLSNPFDMKLMMDMVLLTVKAGCFNLVRKGEVVPYIIYYGQPMTTTAFLHKMEAEWKQQQIDSGGSDLGTL